MSPLQTENQSPPPVLDLDEVLAATLSLVAPHLTERQRRLFEQAPGYRGTVLLRPAQAGEWWLTIDRWETEAHFEAFQDEFGVQYRGLDRELEGLAGEEVFVGAFEED